MSPMKTPAILLSLLFLAACSNRKSNEAKTEKAEKTDTGSAAAKTETFHLYSGSDQAKKDQPGHVEVEHILIAFRDGKMHLNPRSREEAEALVKKILEELKKGADFTGLANQYSDDNDKHGKANGPYSMANFGVMPRPGEVPRKRMVQDFGDVAFSLKVGEVGVAAYDPPSRCPYGWHIIKRIR